MSSITNGGGPGRYRYVRYVTRANLPHGWLNSELEGHAWVGLLEQLAFNVTGSRPAKAHEPRQIERSSGKRCPSGVLGVPGAQLVRLSKLSWLDAVSLIGFGGLWMALFFWNLPRRPLLPTGAPDFLKVLNHGRHH